MEARAAALRRHVSGALHQGVHVQAPLLEVGPPRGVPGRLVGGEPDDGPHQLVGGRDEDGAVRRVAVTGEEVLGGEARLVPVVVERHVAVLLRAPEHLGAVHGLVQGVVHVHSAELAGVVSP